MRSRAGWPSSQAWREPSWCSIMPGSGRRSRFLLLSLSKGRALARRLRNYARPLQMQLEPGVAPAKAVVRDQMLVKVLDRKTLVALAVEPLHLLRPVDRNPLARRLAEPAVQKPGLAVFTRQRLVQRRNVRSLTPSNSAASS